MANKKMITVFILDDEVDGVMDSQGNAEKKPMLHSLACVYADHKDIGTKLLTAGADDVFHAEDMVHAINQYKKPEKKKPSKKKTKKDDKGTYDNKVMSTEK